MDQQFDSWGTKKKKQRTCNLICQEINKHYLAMKGKLIPVQLQKQESWMSP